MRYYGQWMRDEAEKRIGHLYPKVMTWKDTKTGRHYSEADVVLEGAGSKGVGNRLEASGPKPIPSSPETHPSRAKLKTHANNPTIPYSLTPVPLTVIAWLWARTVPTPNPAFAGVEVPLVSTFMLSTKPGKEAYVEPVVEGRNYRFEVRVGKPADPKAAEMGTTAGKRQAFVCLLSGTALSYTYIREQAQVGKMKSKLMAVVAEGERGRVYLSPTQTMEEIANSATPEWMPETLLPDNTRDFKTPNYGLETFGSLFTPRQLVALNTFCDLVQEARAKVEEDARTAGLSEEAEGLEAGGVGAKAYAEAVAVYISFAISRAADRGSSVCSWDSSPKMEALRSTFGRQAIPMVWDFAEGNPFSESSGNWTNNVDWVARVIDMLPATAGGCAVQADASTQRIAHAKCLSTDPPYYDNIGYADLSDFFYVWLRRSLSSTLPALFSTIAVPKAEELIASPYRHGGKAQAEQFFMEGMTAAMRSLAEQAHDHFPVTIYYAFKQSENDDVAGQSSTGWETFLEAVLSAGFSIHGTWPMRTELANRMIGSGTNALASSIVLVCRKKDRAAAMTSRKDFLRELRAELPKALRLLQQGNIAPVDLAQASIGPGMAVFSRHSRVVEANGDAMTVKTALGLINQILDEVLAEQEGEFDPETRWALAWFEQFAFDPGQYGDAETLSKAKNTSVAGLVEAGFLKAKSGKVRLLTRLELPAKWDPREDKRLTIWEVSQHLIRVLETKGEAEAGALLRQVGGVGEVARDLAYRLYTLCERKKWAEEARAYNGLVIAWPELQKLAAQAPAAPASDGDLFGGGT